ncbi:hypothetical protein GCM10011351_02370 [Paraliobacillus quinghaiensis]|uniref:Lipoprotein n=1 Tax=Paraliobacillus quinghaiensis TaxID=470815 RepID=A0A917TE16_9BACI|nr:hypothetical protein [Paraliobacillus quinghaiensis]GGM20056.1 hypothetical protein GCM10011351_02370 [Paraliobacillus quinghaiensis]
MSKYCVTWIITLIVLLIGCSEQTPAIKKIETNEIQNESVAIVEQPSEDKKTDAVEKIIEFNLPTEQVLINLNQVPILKNYLSQIKSQTNAINNMELTRVDTTSRDSLYLLAFACQELSCSYLLLDTDQGNSFLLADMSNFSSVKTSPDQTKLLFQFMRNTSDQTWQKHKLAVFDIEKWESISLKSESNISLGVFSWPIQEIEWKDDSTVLATIPAVEEPTSQIITDWLKSDQVTREIALTLADN